MRQSYLILKIESLKILLKKKLWNFELFLFVNLFFSKLMIYEK